MPAPSARTKPSRSRSKGLDALAGSSFRVLRDRAAQNEPNPMGVQAASDPPVMMMSLRPVATFQNASPMV